MKVRFLLICWICITFPAKTIAQESTAYQSKWQITAQLGVNFPGSKLLQGVEYDNFVGYNDNSYHWQLLSITYFFHRHWGLEFNFQTCTPPLGKKKEDSFREQIGALYNDEYYTTTTSSLSEETSRGYLGAVYRFETNKFYLYPKMAIGLLEIKMNTGRADLKRKNSNRQYVHTYSSDKKYGSYFVLAPALSFGYKLHPRIFLNAELMCTYFKPEFTYEKTFKDLYTKESLTDTYTYRKNIFSFSAGIGLRVIIH